MPSIRVRRAVALVVVGLAVVALGTVAGATSAFDAGVGTPGQSAVDTPSQSSESARSSVIARTDVDRNATMTGENATGTEANATMNVTILSTLSLEWTELDDRAAVRAATANGTLSRSGTVAVGEPLVVSIRHPGLAEYLARGNATRRFRSTMESRAGNLSVLQTNPPPQRRSAWLRYPRNATRVIADPATNRTYVVIDTTRAPVVRDRDGDPPPERVDYHTGSEFAAVVTLSTESNLTAGGGAEATSDPFRLKVRRASPAVDDPVSRVAYVRPTPNQTVRGETNVRPGRNVTVVVRGGDDPDTPANESFVRTATATVREGPDDAARFAAAFDFTGVPSNATARVDVRYDGRSILDADATVRVVAPVADLRVREVDPDAVGPYLRVRADADLSRGGFVALHRGSPDGPVVGASEYLPPGSHANVTVYVGDRISEPGRLVAVAHRDANYNHWFDGPDRDPAYADGAPVVETGHVLRPGTAETVTRTATPTLATTRTATTTRTAGTTPAAVTTARTATTTHSGTDTTDPSDATTAGTTAATTGSGDATTTTTDSPTTVPVPGFGVASAAVALLAAVFAVARRR